MVIHGSGYVGAQFIAPGTGRDESRPYDRLIW
jgi:hypothetical protein